MKYKNNPERKERRRLEAIERLQERLNNPEESYRRSKAYTKDTTYEEWLEQETNHLNYLKEL